MARLPADFREIDPLLLTRKGRSGNPTLCYFRRLFVVVFVVVVCLFVVILFRFFFSQCRKLSINLSKDQRVPVHQSFTRKHNMYFYQLPVE